MCVFVELFLREQQVLLGQAVAASQGLTATVCPPRPDLATVCLCPSGKR